MNEWNCDWKIECCSGEHCIWNCIWYVIQWCTNSGVKKFVLFEYWNKILYLNKTLWIFEFLYSRIIFKYKYYIPVCDLQ